MDPWDRSIKIQHGNIHGTYGKKYTTCKFSYSQVSNKRACLFIDFQLAPSACSYSPLLVY